MSRALFPGPYNDYSGVIREVLGDEYQNVVALLKLIPELRDMVVSVHEGVKEHLNTDLVAALEDIKTGLSLAQDKFKETVDCANKEIGDNASNSATAFSKALKDQADTLRSQMSGWGATVIDSIKANEQPVVDAATASIQAAKDARVAELATALQDAANQRITDVQNAAATSITQIQTAQSNIQVLQYNATTDDITKAPTPSNTNAPAFLFYTLSQGKPFNVFRVYVWNITNQAWGTKSLEMDQPADGAQGPKGDNGTIIIPAVWTTGSTIPAVTRADGSAVVLGDLLLNGTDGSLYQNTSSTPGQPNWNATGSLRGPAGSAPDLSMVIKTTSDSTDDPVDLMGINTTTNEPWVRDKTTQTVVPLARSADLSGYIKNTGNNSDAPVNAVVFSGGAAGNMKIPALIDATGVYYNMVLAADLANSISGVPIGVPIPWPNTSIIPSNALIMQGQSFSAANNARLAAMYPNLIIPDMRGLFIRGLDTTGNIDVTAGGRTILSFQEGSILLAKQDGNLGTLDNTRQYGTYNGMLQYYGWDPMANTGFGVNTVWTGGQAQETAYPSINTASLGISRPKNMAWLYIVRVV